MPENFVQKHTASVLFESSPKTMLQPPSWYSEALIVAQYWKNKGLFDELNERVRVHRGRAGKYEVCDFVLLMIAYAVSGLESFERCRELSKPFDPLLSSTWERIELPAGSTLSRFLADIGGKDVENLRELLFHDFIQSSVSSDQSGGIFDRNGGRHIIFDLDPSVETSRQRALCSSPEYPEPRRHRKLSSAPGYTGRKRGEVVFSRATLQQCHTSEWLGSWATPGNTKVWENLDELVGHVEMYTKSKGLEPEQAILRLDGAYGHAETPVILARRGVGYLGRCVRYGLLKNNKIIHCLRSQTPQIFKQPDTGLIREVYDAGEIEWEMGKSPGNRAISRIIITRFKHQTGKKNNIGKYRGGWVYELFMTDRKQEDFLATDIVSMYFGRGGFESTLAQEDRECDPGRWLSNHLYGQSFWQLLCQHTWNLRLQLGMMNTSEKKAVTTLWAESTREKEKREEHENSDEYECLDGLQLKRLDDYEPNPRRNRVVFLAPQKFCRMCPKKSECQLGEKYSKNKKKVTLCFSEEEERNIKAKKREREGVVSLVGVNPVLLESLHASRVRNGWRKVLEKQRLEFETLKTWRMEPCRENGYQTRSERARRRLTWKKRAERNQLKPGMRSFKITFHGLLREIAKNIGFFVIPETS